MQNFKAMIFDMDGLLIDSERLALQAFQETCSKFNLGDLDEVFMRCVGMNAELGKSTLKAGLEGLADYKEFGLEWDKLYSSLTLEPIPLKVGVKNLLEHIDSLNIPMAVATSSRIEKSKIKLSHAKIIQYFDTIIGGDQVENSKPAPEIYLKAAAALSIEASQCLAFEDSPNGVKAAVAAGMTVVQIPDLLQPDEDLLSLGHIVLNRIDDVIDYDFSN